jgi:hypothetical protein
MALAPQDVCGAAAWGPQPTAMQTEHVARGGRHWACSIAEKKLEKAAPRAGVSLDNWGLLCGRACQVFFIVFLPCCSNGSSEIPALWLTTCAGGSMVRGARWLRTTFYPWRAISPAHPILQALSAPVKPRVGNPSSASVRPANPGPATSSPHQRTTFTPVLQTFAHSRTLSTDDPAFRTAPAGRAPVSRKRQRTISHLRARATSPMCRQRALPWPHRAWDHGVNVRVGCKRTQPHAISLAMVRLEPFPACVIPRSREAWPRWEGVGVRPAHAPTCCGVCTSRQAKHAMTQRHARCTPMPRRVVNWRTFAMTGSARVRRAAHRAASRGVLCSGRPWTCCHARLRRARKAAGSGAPSHWRTGSRGVSISPCHPMRRPEPASSPLRRLRTRVRSRFVVSRSRGNGRRSASPTLGTRTTRHPCFSPAA